jgi:hypothetical protein
MAVYTVLTQRVWPEGAELVRREFPNQQSYQVTEQIWFVRDKLTPQQVAEKLGVKFEDGAGGLGNLIVLRVAGSYWGRAPADLWDWLQAAIEADGNG